MGWRASYHHDVHHDITKPTTNRQFVLQMRHGLQDRVADKPDAADAIHLVEQEDVHIQQHHTSDLNLTVGFALQRRHGLQDRVADQLGAADAIDLTGQEGVFADDDGESGPQEDTASELHAFEIHGAHVSQFVCHASCKDIGFFYTLQHFSMETIRARRVGCMRCVWEPPPAVSLTTSLAHALEAGGHFPDQHAHAFQHNRRPCLVRNQVYTSELAPHMGQKTHIWANRWST